MTETNLATINSDNNYDCFIQEFIQSIDVKDITRQYYKAQTRYFFQWVNETNAIFSENVLIEYKNDLQKKGLSIHTINAYLVSVKRFFCYLYKKKIIPYNPSDNVNLFVAPQGHLREAFTTKEVRKILKSINLKTVEGKRNYAMISLLARCGLRTIELIRADVGDIKERYGKTILAVHGKKRDTKDEIVVLTNDALKPIKLYLKSKPCISNDEPLFNSLSNRNKNGRLTTRGIRKIIQKQLAISGLANRKLSGHSFRHFSASAALQNGADITKVQRMLRHKNINTSMIYIHEMSRLKKSAEEYIEI